MLKRCCSQVVCKNVLRLAGKLPIVRVLNDFQPLLILRAN
ncbi:capsid protein [Salmonella enterica subsp. enterica serovar Typhimurium]|nr:capsid protein [Salmonella enterica]EBR8491281.1 capsid protein [Salmonella enterica subsp. enterica serovar Hull]EBU6493565.1 capsid protein [Salmonella enterica subsp. enterica serovar Typhimurium]EBV5359246.1 capsid protein [Salmonella enterica subsp. enterica serovar Saintpaul]ECJ4975635.1 capsid protein [Salmonella enterica subsp. enterica]